MKTKSEMVTALLRDAAARGLNRAAAVEVVKRVLSAFDLDSYSWSQEQALCDALRNECLLYPLAGLAKALKAENDLPAAGACAALQGALRGRVGCATAS